jgi:MFS family permease
VIAGALGGAGLLGYAAWERASPHPMTPPRLLANRPFVGLNLATLLIYAALSIMFFVLSFDLIDRRGLPPTQAGLVFLPFTLGMGLLSRIFGTVADKVGARPMLIVGPLSAAFADVWLALGHDAGLVAGVIAPLALLGIAFAALVPPLTASVMSSVDQAEEGLASGINNAASRIAQLIGIALAAGVASFAAGYRVVLIVAAGASIAGAVTIAMTVPAAKPKG